jgi:chromosome partitioning protein
MARILAIANQKGGVGKTTTSVNLSACLAELGQRVLMVDLDPQGNATTGCGVVKREALPTVYQLLIGDASLAHTRVTTEFGFDVLPSNRELAGAEVELIEIDQREFRLRDMLHEAANEYDFVIIDCPPALNMLTVNGLVAAEAVMIPMQCEYYALEGLTDARNRRAATHNVRSSLDIDAAGVGRTGKSLRR